jgi:hypothetical protein
VEVLVEGGWGLESKDIQREERLVSGRFRVVSGTVLLRRAMLNTGPMTRVEEAVSGEARVTSQLLACLGTLSFVQNFGTLVSVLKV